MNRISNAPSTQGGYEAAIKRFDEFQKARNDPVFSDLKKVHVRDDHLQKLMLDFGTYLVQIDIPYANRVLSAETKSKYFEKLKEALKEKFPKHKAFDDERWYTSLRKDIEKGATRTNLLSNESFENKTLPFYPLLVDTYVREKHRSLILHGDLTYASDMRSLCCLLIKAAGGPGKMVEGGPLQQRVWFVMSMLAIGRGGEIKFQRYDEWHWDELFQAIDSTWTEIKTLTQHCMLFGPDKESYLCDFFHAFGSFFSVENGLYRARELDPAIHKFVFPHLHGIQNSSVAGKLTSIMRSYLPPAVKDSISSRSIRRGATTFLSMHPSITEAELNARGCWASETNSKAYRETTPILSIPGQNALANWMDIRTIKYPPRLECLGSHTHDNLEKFMDRLYVVDVPAFGPGGTLRPFLRACTAAIIMYHFQVVKDYGPSHPLVERVVRVAEEIDLCDGALSDPSKVLRHWASKIKADFDNQNPDIIDPAQHSLQDCLKQNNVLLQKVLADNASYRITINEQQSTLDHVVRDIVRLTRATEEMAHSVASGSRERSPQRRRLPSSSAPSVANDGIASTANVTTDMMSQPNNSELTADGKRQSDQLVALAGDQAPASKRRSIPSTSLKKNSAFLTHSSAAEAAGKSSAKTPIADVLFQLYEAKAFQGHKDRLRSISLSHFNEKDKFAATMELVECLISDDQWSKLCTCGQPVREMMDTTNAVQQVCMTTLRAWEESAGLKEPLRKKSSERAMPYFIGVGARVVAYKKACGINGHLSTAAKSTVTVSAKPAAAKKPMVKTSTAPKSNVPMPATAKPAAAKKPSAKKFFFKAFVKKP